jgi:dTDP-4-dehydrorhamnose 3,5-epimerase
MRFQELALAGVFLVEPERHEDERGYFARTYCTDELAAHGLDPQVAQVSVSHNTRRGTLRGMHFQVAPHEETKLVRCTRGALHDVVVDLRVGSPTHAKWVAVDLDAEDGLAMYVPKGCAHGFLTLEDDTTVEYVISVPYAPEAAAVVRFDDPAFGIEWPFAPEVVSDRDRSFPLMDRAGGGA